MKRQKGSGPILLLSLSLALGTVACSGENSPTSKGTNPLRLNPRIYALGTEPDEPMGSGTAASPGKAHKVLTIGAIDVSTQTLRDHSGRGPTSDGRIKPDLLAPTNVDRRTGARCAGPWRARPNDLPDLFCPWRIRRTTNQVPT